MPRLPRGCPLALQAADVGALHRAVPRGAGRGTLAGRRCTSPSRPLPTAPGLSGGAGRDVGAPGVNRTPCASKGANIWEAWAWGRYGAGWGSVGGRIGRLHDTVVLLTVVVPNVVVPIIMVPIMVVPAVVVLAVVVPSPGEPWGAGRWAAATCRAVLSGVPTLVPFVPVRVGGTYKGSCAALLPPGAGGSGAGDLCPLQSTQGTLAPCRDSCGPIAPTAGDGQGRGWGLRTPPGVEQREEEEEDGGTPAALAAAKASHGLLMYNLQQTDPSSRPPPRVALRLLFPGPTPRFAPRNPRGRHDMRSQKSSRSVPGAHLSGTGPSLPSRGGRISLSRSG